MNLNEAIRSVYGKQFDDCAQNIKDHGSHIGDMIVTYDEELEDDRYVVIKMEQCAHCWFPVHSEPASPDEREAYYDQKKSKGRPFIGGKGMLLQ